MMNKILKTAASLAFGTADAFNAIGNVLLSLALKKEVRDVTFSEDGDTGIYRPTASERWNRIWAGTIIGDGEGEALPPLSGAITPEQIQHSAWDAAKITQGEIKAEKVLQGEASITRCGHPWHSDPDSFAAKACPVCGETAT